LSFEQFNMETIRIKRKITSSQIRISELKKFIGKQVEITVTEKKTRVKRTLNNAAAGILEKYKNSGLSYAEKEAWNIAVNEKHGNY
jgi:hypothetical protein